MHVAASQCALRRKTSHGAMGESWESRPALRTLCDFACLWAHEASSASRSLDDLSLAIFNSSQVCVSRLTLIIACIICSSEMELKNCSAMTGKIAEKIASDCSHVHGLRRAFTFTVAHVISWHRTIRTAVSQHSIHFKYSKFQSMIIFLAH